MVPGMDAEFTRDGAHWDKFCTRHESSLSPPPTARRAPPAPFRTTHTLVTIGSTLGDPSEHFREQLGLAQRNPLALNGTQPMRIRKGPREFRQADHVPASGRQRAPPLGQHFAEPHPSSHLNVMIKGRFQG